MSYQRYLIYGPDTLRDRANEAAATWDPVGGRNSFLPSMLALASADAGVATHTAIHLRIDDDVAPLIQGAIEANFPGWGMIQCDHTHDGLEQSGLVRVVGPMP